MGRIIFSVLCQNHPLIIEDYNEILNVERVSTSILWKHHEVSK